MYGCVYSGLVWMSEWILDSGGWRCVRDGPGRKPRNPERKNVLQLHRKSRRGHSGAGAGAV